MDQASTETMTGDAEAAAAIAGMIETYGTPIPDGSHIYTMFIHDRCDDKTGCQYWISAYECLGRLPGNVAVCRHSGGLGQVFLRTVDHNTYNTRNEALAKACEKLTQYRDAIDRQLEAIKAEIVAANAEEVGP
jgi:hypothetical protein